jgi:hypothetical protein
MKSLSVLFVPAALAVTSLAVAQQPAPTQSNLESGGLRPPEAIESSPQTPAEANQETTEKQLEEADKKDSGRGLEWVWLNMEVGAQHIGLATIENDQLVEPGVDTTQTGLLLGAGLGVRLLVFTAGARFRMATFSDFKLWTLDAEGGMRIPLGSLEPYFNVAAGFASMASLSTDAIKSPKGFDARLGVGLDWYISNTFSIGANLSGDVLFLSRSASGDSSSAVYAQDGSSIGAALTGTAVVGLHF